MEEQKNYAARDAERNNIPATALAGGGGGKPPIYTPRENFPKVRAKGRDLVLAAVLLLFCFLLWDSLCWAVGIGLGEAVGLFVLLPAALVYLRGRKGRMTLYAWVCAVLYMLGAGSLALSGDGVLKFFTLCGMVILYLTVFLERLDLRTGNGLLARLHDLFFAAFSMTFGRLRAGGWALTHSGTEDSAHSKRIRAVGVGLLCAAPALLILVPLLISSDAAFEGLINRLDWSAAGRGVIALVCGGFFALLLFSLLYTSDRGPKPMLSAPRKGVEPTAVAAFLGAISAAYILYLVAQFAYFTNAFRGLLPKDYTVAQYARRGFFEMCAIVAFNLGLIVLALGVCRKEGGRVPGVVKGMALFLCLFSLALVATALSKMVLYMNSFGLTRLRVLTSAFMVFLGIVVIAVGLRLFLKKLPVIQLTVALGAVLLIGLSLANVDGIVARYNVDAWKSGRLDSLDIQTICELDDGAIPVLAELAADANETVAKQARDALKFRSVTEDWRSWNLITARASDAMEEFRGDEPSGFAGGK